MVQLAASDIFLAPSTVCLRAGYSYAVPLMDKVVCLVGEPLASFDPTGRTTFPAVYSLDAMAAAIDKADLLSRPPAP
jgi:hypothetical protein